MLSNMLAPPKQKTGSMRDTYLNALQQVYEIVHPGGLINRAGSLVNMLESMKAQMFGKLHMPHSQMIEYGIHAATFELVHRKQTSRTQPKTEQEHVTALMNLLEVLTRIFDQLDEQLHAGSYFFITIGTNKFISNTLFVYPAACIFFGFTLPALIDYSSGDISSDETSSLHSLAQVFSVYVVGAFLVVLPGILHEHVKDLDKVTEYTMIAMAVSVLVLLIGRELVCRKSQAPLVRSYNLLIISIITAAVSVFQFTVTLVNICFVFPMLLSVVGWRNPKASLVSKIAYTIVLLAVATVATVILFGTELQSVKSAD